MKKGSLLLFFVNPFGGPVVGYPSRAGLDCSERRIQLGGKLGKLILKESFANKWTTHELDSRRVLIIPITVNIQIYRDVTSKRICDG